MGELLKRIWSRQSLPREEAAAPAHDEPAAVEADDAAVRVTEEAPLPPTEPPPLPAPTGFPMKRPSKRATAAEMRGDLAKLGLETKGKRETLFKRLMVAYAQQIEAAEAAVKAALPGRPPRQPYMSYLCFDVEGTCEGGKGFDYPNEIIEFPVVLLQWAEDDDSSDEGAQVETAHGRRKRTLVTVDTFHSYVRPTWRPQLSEFCISLTGIQQATVDASPTFPEVLRALEGWLDSWGLRDEETGELVDAMWVTDGPWDLRDFVPKQLHITPVGGYPPYLLGRYLNLKNAVATYLADRESGRRVTTGRVYKTPKEREGPRSLNIPAMLDVLGLGRFDGRQHSGIDDATNIARIVVALAERNVLIEPNGRLPIARNAKRWDWMGAPGEVLWGPPQGLYDAAGVRRKTVFDGAPPDAEPAEPAKAAQETDATVLKLLRDMAVS